MTLPRFTDRIVVINGATGTIGSALAHALQREGAQLVLFGRKADVLDRLAETLTAALTPEEQHRIPLIQPVEFSGAAIEDYQRLAEAIEQTLGRVDILIHAMGSGGQLAPLADSLLPKFQETLHLNLMAPFALTHALWPLLTAARARHATRPQVLFLTDRGTPAFGNAYTVAHAALAQLVRQWAAETEAVRINGFDPGPTHSALRQYRFPGETQAERAHAEDLLPAALDLLADDRRHGEIVRLQPDRV
ncbi:SDR family NAD(P)-dependent oxidoreductase [Halothiobacillus sp. DCM-1]|uniref:SDR family NAD(P)-dependent oxidoreductase n=1 Tax=Halothiobacillus sp. DCM-1 TaxID=3112558 RepID=UPI0032438186